MLWVAKWLFEGCQLLTQTVFCLLGCYVEGWNPAHSEEGQFSFFKLSGRLGVPAGESTVQPTVPNWLWAPSHVNWLEEKTLGPAESLG